MSGRAALMNRKARRASLKDPNHARSPTLRIADLLAQARWYHQQGQSGRAQDICNLILKREPRHVHALNLLGLILQRAGHHRHAARIFAEAVASDEFNAACHYNLGSSYQALNETTKAALHFNRALALGMSEKNSEDFILQNPSIGMCVARILATLPTADGAIAFPNMSLAGGSIANIPIHTSDAAGEAVILIDASALVAAADALELKASSAAALQMDDVPSMASAAGSPSTPTAAQLVSLFQTNSTALKCERTFGFEIIREAGVASLSSVQWGKFGSPPA